MKTQNSELVAPTTRNSWRQKIGRPESRRNFSESVLTFLVVTTVAVMVWIWAAGETQVQRSMNVRVRFAPPEMWTLSPAQRTITLHLEGSRRAVQQTEREIGGHITLEVAPGDAGRHTVDITDHLRRLPQIEGTGAKVVAADPASVEIEADELVRLTARVQPVLPGVQTAGEPEVDPPEVALVIPAGLRARLPRDVIVDAFVDRAQLEALPPDVPQTLEVNLREPEALRGAGSLGAVRINPPAVRLSFTVKSRISELNMENVRIQLAGPPEDTREYIVEFAEPFIRNVTVSADSDLIARLEAREAQVFAVLYLSSREKEQRIESKPISYFIVLVPDAAGVQRGVVVDARVDGSPTPPAVSFTITRRREQ